MFWTVPPDALELANWLKQTQNVILIHIIKWFTCSEKQISKLILFMNMQKYKWAFQLHKYRRINLIRWILKNKNVHIFPLLFSESFDHIYEQ